MSDPPDAPEYDLAGDDPVPPRHPLPTPGPVPAAPLPVVGYRAARREAPTAEQVYFPSKWRDLYAPAALLALALALGFGGLLYLSDDSAARDVVFGSAYAAVKLLMLGVAIPLLTRVAGVSFGTLPQAVLKLSAIALLPEALALLTIIAAGWCFGLVLGPVVALLATWAMFALLFEFEVTESAFCAAVYWGVGFVFAVGWMTLLYWMLAWVW